MIVCYHSALLDNCVKRITASFLLESILHVDSFLYRMHIDLQQGSFALQEIFTQEKDKSTSLFAACVHTLKYLRRRASTDFRASTST